MPTRSPPSARDQACQHNQSSRCAAHQQNLSRLRRQAGCEPPSQRVPPRLSRPLAPNGTNVTNPTALFGISKSFLFGGPFARGWDGVFQTKRGLLTFFPRQSRGETLAGPCAAVPRWRCLFLESISKLPGSPCLRARRYPGTLELPGSAGRRQQGAGRSSVRRLGRGPVVAPVSPQPEHWASWTLPTPVMGWRHSTAPRRAAPGRWLGWPVLPLPTAGSLMPFLLSPGKRKPSQPGAGQEAQPALPATALLVLQAVAPFGLTPALQGSVRQGASFGPITFRRIL